MGPLKWLIVDVGNPEWSTEPVLNEESYPHHFWNASTIVWSVFFGAHRAWLSMICMSLPGLFCRSQMHSTLLNKGQ
jgi:hypothetical protein